MGTSVLAATRELEPLKYINSINKPVHSAMFYNDEKKSRYIEYTFILNGLKKEERCIYVTDENTNQIAAKMKACGISLEKFFEKRLLHIYQVPSLQGSISNIVDNAKKIIEEIVSDTKQPCRLVGRIIRDTATKNGMMAEMQLEKEFHKSFSGFNGTVLCSYPYQQIESTQRERWMSGLLYNHHSAIFVPRDSQGIAVAFT